MKLESEFPQRRRLSRARLARAIAAALVLALAAPAAADDAMDAKQLVEKAKLTIDSFAADKMMGAPVKKFLKNAKGAFDLAPGAEGRIHRRRLRRERGPRRPRREDNAWNGPAFYTIGEASFGLQAGGDASRWCC